MHGCGVMATSLPSPLLEKLSSSLDPIANYVTSNTKTFDKTVLLDSAYIDGSLAVDERRGSLVTLLSVASLYVKGEPLRYEKGLPGRERMHPLVLIPKSYGEERASYFMRGLELLEALRAAHLGTPLVVMDGSYVTLLLSAYGFPEEIASRMGGLHCESDVEVIRAAFDEIAEDHSTEAFYKAVNVFIKAYADALSTSSSWEDALTCTSRLALEIVLETGAALLEEARKKGVDVVWVSKETGMDVLSEKLGVEKWMRDLIALDELWKSYKKCYLTVTPEKEIGKPRRTLAPEDVLARIYRPPWNRYEVTYAKLGGATLQITYPLLLHDVEDVLSTLTLLSSDSGYPRPLIHVHHMAAIPRERARHYADILWASSNGIERILLAPMGRILLGLPG